MAFEFDFITLGDASEKLGVPSATLRLWTDQMEDLEAHFVMRNNRNERIYYESDIEIFAFLRDLRKEYGRRTTTKDLANMVLDKGREGELELRTRENAPVPQASNRTAELMGHEDIKRLMDSDRVKQFMSIIVSETTKNIRDELTKEFESEFEKLNHRLVESNQRLQDALDKKEEVSQEKYNKLLEANEKLKEELSKRDAESQEKLHKELEERDKRWDDRAKERDEILMKSLRETMEKKKGILARIFGG